MMASCLRQVNSSSRRQSRLKAEPAALVLEDFIKHTREKLTRDLGVARYNSTQGVANGRGVICWVQISHASKLIRQMGRART